MSEVKNKVQREKGQIQDLAFKIFAVVGFLSSIVTIISWITSTQASLSSIVTQSTIEMPTDLQISQLPEQVYAFEDAVSDLKERYCNPVAVDYSGSKSKNFLYSADKCNSSGKILDSLSDAVKLDGKKLIAWDISLSNDGKNIAENIILRSPVPVSIRAKDFDGNSLLERFSIILDHIHTS